MSLHLLDPVIEHQGLAQATLGLAETAHRFRLVRFYEEINFPRSLWKCGMDTDRNCRTLAGQPNNGPAGGALMTPMILLTSAGVRADFHFRLHGVMIPLIPLVWRLTHVPAGTWP
jgi:hypothetical protein